MSFSYLQFESHLPSDILRKGKDYYDEGLVVNLASDDDIWAADVQGSDQYYVEVTLSQKEVKDWRCDCPYDWGPICKHIAAVLFAIREAKGQSQTKASSKKSVDSIQQILEKLSQEEMEKALTYLAKRDSEVRSYLLSRYSDLLPVKDKKEYSRLVKAYIKSVPRERDGFLTYRATSRLGHKMYELIDKATAEDMSTIYLCEAAIDQMINSIQNADDSDGMLGGAISTATSKLEEVVINTKEKDPKIAQYVFDWALNKHKLSAYDDVGDFGHNFKRLALHAVNTTAQAQRLKEEFEHYIAIKRTEQYVGYAVKFTSELQFLLLRDWFNKEEADTFFNQHLHLSSFRERALNQALEEKDYEYALQLAKEGIELDTKNKYAGLVRKWKEWLIRIGEVSGDQESLIKLYEEEYLASGRIESYRKLKKILPKSDFDKRVEVIIKTIEQSYQRFKVPMFKPKIANILIEEAKYDEVMQMIEMEADLSLLDTYFALLSPLFPKKYVGLYAQELNKFMETSANNRNAYKLCCQYLNKMIHLGGKEEAITLAHQWQQTYIRRRALQEELGELKWLKD